MNELFINTFFFSKFKKVKGNYQLRCAKETLNILLTYFNINFHALLLIYILYLLMALVVAMVPTDYFKKLTFKSTKDERGGANYHYYYNYFY